MIALLQRALNRIASSPWSDVAWQFSDLNGDGFPVEFTYSSASDTLRFTAEAAGPEVPEHARLDCALSLLDSPPASPALLHQLRHWQQLAPLRFGAWVGGSLSRQKIYVECPPAVPSPYSPAGARLRMLGLSAGALEYYYRRDFLQADSIAPLLARCGLSARLHELLAAISQATGRSTSSHLFGPDSGYSVAETPAGAVFSLFTFARSVWGTDASIRRTLLALHPMPAYAAASAHLAHRECYLTAHGVLAWILAPHSPVEWRISLRPLQLPAN
jgi:hypothetical protein